MVDLQCLDTMVLVSEVFIFTAVSHFFLLPGRRGDIEHGIDQCQADLDTAIQTFTVCRSLSGKVKLYLITAIS
jgi:hypothetical protein